MKNNRMLLFFVVLAVVVLTSCASMDLRVDTLPASSLYGHVPPRLVNDECRWYVSEKAPYSFTYDVLAHYVIQENPVVISSVSAQTMICYAYKIAVKNGADAIIVDEMSTTNVAGYARTSPVVKVTAIRFNGNGDLLPDYIKK